MRTPSLLLTFGVCLAAMNGPVLAAEGATPPYETDLLKLAELLGGLHYLRPLCGMATESEGWRTQMQALMEAEQPSGPRRARIVAAFNQGYNSYAQVYRTCTPAAVTAAQRKLDEGARLAHEIVVRYGGN